MEMEFMYNSSEDFGKRFFTETKEFRLLNSNFTIISIKRIIETGQIKIKVKYENQFK